MASALAAALTGHCSAQWSWLGLGLGLGLGFGLGFGFGFGFGFVLGFGFELEFGLGWVAEVRALMFLTRSWARGSDGWRDRMYSASARA